MPVQINASYSIATDFPFICHPPVAKETAMLKNLFMKRPFLLACLTVLLTGFLLWKVSLGPEASKSMHEESGWKCLKEREL